MWGRTAPSHGRLCGIWDCVSVQQLLRQLLLLLLVPGLLWVISEGPARGEGSVPCTLGGRSCRGGSQPWLRVGRGLGSGEGLSWRAGAVPGLPLGIWQGVAWCGRFGGRRGGEEGEGLLESRWGHCSF
jgi:hypothetical protein